MNPPTSHSLVYALETLTLSTIPRILSMTTRSAFKPPGHQVTLSPYPSSTLFSQPMLYFPPSTTNPGGSLWASTRN